MKDLTVIMLTANKVPEGWARFHREKLSEAIGDLPIITVSYKPLDWGLNLIQTEYSLSNIFAQILRAAKLADTEFIAIAEDDTLYPQEHFEYRPPPDAWGYNINRWKIFAWRKPYFFHKPKAANGTMVGPRDLTIEALEMRFALCPGGELSWGLSKELGVPHGHYGRNYESHGHYLFKTKYPIVSFDHQFSIDPYAQRARKVAGPVQVNELPLWGTARELRGHFQ